MAEQDLEGLTRRFLEAWNSQDVERVVDDDRVDDRPGPVEVDGERAAAHVAGCPGQDLEPEHAAPVGLRRAGYATQRCAGCDGTHRWG